MPEGSSDGHIAALNALKKQLKKEKEEHQKTTDMLKEKRQAIDRLKSNSERQRRRVAELEEETRLARQEIDALSEAPHEYARIVRIHDDGLVDIVRGTNVQHVKVRQSVDRELLTPGRLVFVTMDTGSVISLAPELDDAGIVYTYAHVLNDQNVIVEDESGHGMTVWLKHGLNSEFLTNGDKVIVSDSFVIRLVEADSRDALGFAGQFVLEPTDTTFDEVAGLEDIVDRLKWKITMPHEKPHLFSGYQLEPRLMACLSGPPGNGKTTMARAIANLIAKQHHEAIAKHAKSNFIYVSGPQLSHWLVGRGEHHIREMLEGAQRLHNLTGAPVVVYFDDCDSFFRERGSRAYSGANEDYVNQFNASIEGARKLRGVYIFLATNRPDIIDTATLDRMHSMQVYVPPPDTPERAAAVLRVHLSDAVIANGEDPIRALVGRIFAKMSDNNILRIRFSGERADETYALHRFISGRWLRAVTDTAKEHAIRRDKDVPADGTLSGVTEADILAAFEEKLKEKVFPENPEKVREWLDQRRENRTITRITPLRSEKIRDQLARRQEHIAQSVQ